MKRPLLFCLFLAAVFAGPLAAAPYDVRDFGAIGDGRTLDTAAINAAIEAASAEGGGTVVFPAGDYLSFTVRLKSHVTLHLEPGSTLVAAEPSADLSQGYDAPEPNPVTDQYEDFGHSHWRNSLIWGEDLEDIAITGTGMIFGFGLSRGDPGFRRDLLPEERGAAEQPDRSVPAEALAAIATQMKGPFGYPGEDTLPPGVGNKAIALKNCRNVLLRDFTIYHGGHFAILATGVDNFTCDNLKIDTNRDGIDLDCCRNVRVSNCTINSPYDDALCLKSSYGLGYARMTENVTIMNCQVCGYDEGALLDGTHRNSVRGLRATGRIKFGTESNGGFRNIAISNCVFDSSHGLALEMVDGGLLEDVTISNLTMRGINNAPIFIRLGARLRGPEGTTMGAVRRIKIQDLVVQSDSPQSGILIAGLIDEPIEDLTLSNIFISYPGGGTAEQGERVVPEYAADYPEPGRFGTMPAWGLWARHVRNLSIDRVEFRAREDDFRPTVILDDVTEASIVRAKLPHAPGAPAIRLREVTDFTLSDSEGLVDARRTKRVVQEEFSRESE